MHVNSFSVNCSVSLELWYLLKSHRAGNEKLSRCARAQVALTFEGKAFDSVLELALTWFPLGDFFAFWLSVWLAESVLLWKGQQQAEARSVWERTRARFPLCHPHENQFGAWHCRYVWFASNDFPVLYLSSTWQALVAGRTAADWRHRSCSASPGTLLV